MTITAIIPAAGRGTRMGAPVAKQFLELKGKPILHYTLEVFERCGVVDSVVLVVPESDVESARRDWNKPGRCVRGVVAGGAQRQDSVWNGLHALDPDTEIVIVHDGVRPFVTEAILRNSVETAREFGAALAAVPVSDTLKQADSEHWVTRTVDRRGLWRVQTPQTFRLPLLIEAFEKAYADSYYGTDEGSLVEYLGQPVKIVEGSELNIKITRREDLALGEMILESRTPRPNG
ncbi:MAG: 2-C-methyl-D-erythritol 4-phosphate cytidylyltransferase [Nitrospinaceae bacterium]|nr:2-C-methyl-D-erythritol 4-phosphate cytidylyltransferase [Nitrospinaceae bacterium]NIR56905.1 2-C-methyl-D-erythritol 4-phosphate cytidylyltransferase [Nitrospinaceae bacterium]NIS87367.1 2-C-methyl-D-erythritol 4-phosphate cytidylyltransferase [Nitrospinaceae bacterium]NIT84222.1 2-C-methyl-D-erythritol 4-phosphate cytidylyltransferase [Nitrospinaceae bacterium]NIU46407.1 2-C-methyl-D-erythritol 4-phosphate cytidylyltransferase [Nitrospinaceae bacterium]